MIYLRDAQWTHGPCPTGHRGGKFRKAGGTGEKAGTTDSTRQIEGTDGTRIMDDFQKMKVTIVYDNEVSSKGLQADWGFSCVVEIENAPKILFDTGADGEILLSNMAKLHIDPQRFDKVFISHSHFDHIGGLPAFLKVNNDVKVFVPVSVSGTAYVAWEITRVKEPVQIYEGVFSTGEIDGIEQSMAIKTKRGVVLIVGCSHPKMTHILREASQFGNIYGVIGGLHGFKQFDLFNDFSLICAAHCTQNKKQLRSLYPDKYIDGGVGKIIMI